MIKAIINRLYTTPSEETVKGNNSVLPKPVMSPKKFIRMKGKTIHPRPDKVPFMSERLSLILEATQMER